MTQAPSSGASVRERVDRLRRVVLAVSAEIEEEAADLGMQLARAAEFSGSPAEEVLVMREALISTRPAWEDRALGASPQAIEALADAKRLAIEL